MSHTYTPDTENDPDTATVPDDGDDLTVGSILPAVEAALDKIAHTQAHQIIRTFFTNDYVLSSLTKTINTLADEDVFVIVENAKAGDVVNVDCAFQWAHSGSNGADRAVLFRIDDADGIPSEDTIKAGGAGSAGACTAVRSDNNTQMSSATVFGSYVVTADGDSRISVRFGAAAGTCTIQRVMLRATIASEV
jgi:hypothetical protein